MSLSKIKLFYTILFSLTLIGFFTTCKKYDEDGKRSWHKPEKRIIGKWFLKEFLVDGNDSIYKCYKYYDMSLFDTIKWQLINMRYSFNEENNQNTSDFNIEEFYFLNALGNSIHTFHCFGGWSFSNKKKTFNLNTVYTNENISFSIFGSKITNDWTIKKLTDKEFFLETKNINDKTLKLKFQK